MVERWRHPNRRDPRSLPVELRRAPPSRAVLAWVEQSSGSPVVRVRRLPGASSTAVHGLRTEAGADLVLRVYCWPGFLQDEPLAPQREVDALRWACDAGLSVPEVVAADPAGSAVGSPALLMVRLPGRAQARPPVRRLAELAAAVHGVSADGFGHRWFPWCRQTSTRAPVGAADPRVWEKAHELWREGPPAEPATFVHRDLHPGNVLWSRGRLTGLVDWANACRGPAGVDVATCRWQLAGWAGEVVADRFVAAYEELTGRIQHPYWDLAGLLEDDWDLGQPVEQVRTVEARLAKVLPRLA